MAKTDKLTVEYTFLPENYSGTDTNVSLDWQQLQTRSSPPQKGPKPPPVFCPWTGCGKSLVRKQELERHTLTAHLPCSICCPVPTCRWRGSRKDELIKHLQGNKECGPQAKLDSEECIIYDKRMILDCMYEDTPDTAIDPNSKLKVVQELALDLVQERAKELQKDSEDLWGDDAWGHGRQAKGRAR